MGRSPMPSERKEKIKEIASQMNYIEASKILGLSRRTISRIVRGKESARKHRENRFVDLRRAEAKIVPEGCFNVHSLPDWLTGVGEL